MSTIFTHKSGYLISVKLLEGNVAKCNPEEWEQKLALGEFKQLESSTWMSLTSENSIETNSLKQVDEFLFNDDELRSYSEIKPNFTKTEIIINNFLLFLFTIAAGIIAFIVSPFYIVSLIKYYYRKITDKNRR